MGLCDLTWWSCLTLVVIFGRELDRRKCCLLRTLKCSLKSVPSYESSPDSSTSYSRKTRSTYSSQAFCLCSPKNLSAKPEFTLFISFLWKEGLFIVRKWLLYRLCTNHMARHFHPPDQSAIKMHCSCMLVHLFTYSNPLSPCPPFLSFNLFQGLGVSDKTVCPMLRTVDYQSQPDKNRSKTKHFWKEI